MATTQNYYNQETPQFVRDPKLLPVFYSNGSLRLPYTSQTLTGSNIWTSSSSNFWSEYARVGTYSTSNTTGWVTIIDISSSTKPILLCGVLGAYSSHTISQTIEITVDGTVYSMTPIAAQSGGFCWGSGWDYTGNTYGGSNQYQGQGRRFGGPDTHSATGDVHSTGRLSVTGACPMSVGETMAMGAPVLRAETSLKVRHHASVPSSWPYRYGYRGCQWAYLPA